VVKDKLDAARKLMNLCLNPACEENERNTVALQALRIIEDNDLLRDAPEDDATVRENDENTVRLMDELKKLWKGKNNLTQAEMNAALLLGVLGTLTTVTSIRSIVGRSLQRMERKIERLEQRGGST